MVCKLLVGVVAGVVAFSALTGCNSGGNDIPEPKEQAATEQKPDPGSTCTASKRGKGRHCWTFQAEPVADEWRTVGTALLQNVSGVAVDVSGYSRASLRSSVTYNVPDGEALCLYYQGDDPWNIWAKTPRGVKKSGVLKLVAVDKKGSSVCHDAEQSLGDVPVNYPDTVLGGAR